MPQHVGQRFLQDPVSRVIDRLRYGPTVAVDGQNGRITEAGLKQPVVEPAVQHAGGAVQLGIAAGSEFVLRVGQNGRQESAIDARYDSELRIGHPLTLLYQVFGPRVGIDAVDYRFELARADAETHQYPHERMQHAAAHENQGRAGIRHRRKVTEDSRASQLLFL